LLQRQLEGYLAKEGNVGLGKGRLKKRWFVLQGFELHYYKSNDKGKSLGFIPMEKVIAVNIVEDQKKRERYRIVSHAIPYHTMQRRLVCVGLTHQSIINHRVACRSSLVLHRPFPAMRIRSIL
jgi:hypothetical protein